MAATKKLINAQTITATTNGAAKSGFAGKSRFKSQATVASIGGASPSFTVSIEDSIDGVNWTTVVSHTALTANGSNSAVVSETQGSTERVIGPYLRARVVVSGTTPTGVVTVTVYAE